MQKKCVFLFKTYYVLKKNYLIVIVTFALISCNKAKVKKDLVFKNESQITSFIKKALDSNSKLTEKEKLKMNTEAFKLISVEKNSLKKRNKLDTIINIFFNSNDWENYNSSSKHLLSESKLANDTLNQAKSMRYLGNCFYNDRRLDSSFYYYLNSERLFFAINDKFNYSVVLLKKGIVQLDINDVLGADISLSKAYNELSKTDDYQRIYATLTTLGSVSSELKEYDRALSYFNKALDVVKDAKLETEENQEANCLNNIGLLYNDKKDYKRAIYFYRKALEKSKIRVENPELYSIIIDNLAFSLLKSKSLTNLPKLFYVSLKVKDSLSDENSKVSIFNHLSEYYFLVKDTTKAIEFSEKALNIANKSKIPFYITSSLKQAIYVNKKNASTYSNRYINIFDSLRFVERISKDRFARIELETDQIIKEKEFLVEKNRDTLNYFLGTMIVVGALFFMKSQRSRARLLALKQAQQQANEEIYRLIISHQNQLELGKDLEKKRLSKELHDGVLGRLFGLRLSLDGLNSFDDEQAKKERLEYLNELQLIEQDLREISHELNRETSLLINNFVAIINSLIEQQAKVNNANIKVVIGKNIDWDKISNIVKINLYRILQEALQNINKHAGAKNVLVYFRKDTKENLLFNIEDDGKGFDTNIKKNKGIGTKNMVSRVHQCNGSIDIKSEIGKGSKIIIIFPLENSNFKV